VVEEAVVEVVVPGVEVEGVGVEDLGFQESEGWGALTQTCKQVHQLQVVVEVRLLPGV
jgi:hypothetical protein